MIEKVFKGIDYGLSLYYSYTLPLFDVSETDRGFVFEKTTGFCKGLKCFFVRGENEARCLIPDNCIEYSKHLLGLDSSWGYQRICEIYGERDCVAKHITLLYSPEDAKYILYAVLLSRNTDWFLNAVRWFKEYVSKGSISTGSYIAKQFLELRPKVDEVVNEGRNPLDVAVSLLRIPNINMKTVSALLLHSYGLTEYAPVDRHYRSFLEKVFGYVKAPKKDICIENKLNCYVCRYRERCVYGLTRSVLRSLNGYIQSLVYLSNSLSMYRSRLEEILVPKSHRDTKTLSEIVYTVTEKILRDAKAYEWLQPI